MINDYIAERKLICCLKGDEQKFEISIRIGKPFPTKLGELSDLEGQDCYACKIEFHGIEEKISDVYGVDSLQAINHASDIEHIIRNFGKKYDFFWLSGDPYFDSE